MPLPVYAATRYVAPLREGGSLPALVDTDDGGLFVVKFRGAGQGPKVLVAEILAGELARAAGLPVPEIAVVTVDAAFGRTERDPEIQDLLRASEGRNVGLAFLAPALAFDPVATPEVAPPELAADVLWLDALTFNIDRTARNPNLIVAPAPHAPAPHAPGDAVPPSQLWLIDHGVAFYFHHDWQSVKIAERAASPFPPIHQHVLLPLAGSVADADERLRARLTLGRLDDVLALLPDDLLMATSGGRAPDFPTPDGFRDAYRAILAPRLGGGAPFVAAADRARLAAQSGPHRPLAYRR